MQTLSAYIRKAISWMRSPSETPPRDCFIRRSQVRNKIIITYKAGRDIAERSTQVDLQSYVPSYGAMLGIPDTMVAASKYEALRVPYEVVQVHRKADGMLDWAAAQIRVFRTEQEALAHHDSLLDRSELHVERGPRGEFIKAVPPLRVRVS